MPESGERTFTDVEDYAKALEAARVELVVTSPGSFRARLTRLSLPHLRLLALSESLSRIAYFALPADRVFVTFPSRPTLICGGVTLQRGDIVFHSRGERLHQRLTGPANWGLLSLEPEHLAAAGRALTGLAVVAPPSGRLLRPARPAIRRLLRLCAAAAHFAGQRPTLVLDPEVARSMQHDLIESLVACLAPENEREDLALRRPQTQVMARLEHLLAAGPARVMCIRELCAAVDVSERTLRSYCTEYLGISPSRYMRLRRLKLAHVALRAHDPAPASVADVARNYGFFGFGRFAAAYQAAFGEKPSVTLRRAHEGQGTARFSESA